MSDAESREIEPENIKRRMADIRERLNHHVEGMVEDARTLVDWRHYVRQYPWVCFGAAAALGALVVPRRLEIMRPDAETLAALARQQRLVIEPKAQAKKEERGAVGALLAWAGGMLLRQGFQYAGQQLAANFRQCAVENQRTEDIAQSDGSHRTRRPR